MIGLVLLAASAVADTQQLQRQLDFIVARCRADDIVHLRALPSKAVAVEMKKRGQLPTVSENESFQCVLGKVKERSDLHFGVVGHEQPAKVEKQ